MITELQKQLQQSREEQRRTNQTIIELRTFRFGDHSRIEDLNKQVQECFNEQRKENQTNDKLTNRLLSEQIECNRTKEKFQQSISEQRRLNETIKELQRCQEAIAKFSFSDGNPVTEKQIAMTQNSILETTPQTGQLNWKDDRF